MMSSEDSSEIETLFDEGPFKGSFQRGLVSLFTVEDTFEGTENGWTVENKKAFSLLSKKIHRSSFVFQYVLERQRRNRGRVSIVSYLLSGSAGVGSTVTSILNASSKIVMGVSIAGVILTATGVALVWMSKNYFEYDACIEKCTAYTAKLDALYIEFGKISTTPPSRRENALNFLNRVTLAYESLIREEPIIDESLLLEASNEFDKKRIINV